MNKIIFTGILCLIGLFSGTSNAQSIRNTANQTHAWFMYFGNHKITDKFSIHTEIQWRRHDFVNDPQQLLTRIGLDYHLKNGISLTAGYGFIITHPYGEQPVAMKFNEHRIWQQMVIKQNVGRLFFNHRYRLEQRFLDKIVTDPDGGNMIDGVNYVNRFRYRALVNIPLNHKTMEAKTVFLSFYDEPFLAFGKNVKSNIFDQNRISAMMGYQFSKNGNIQAGYLNQMIFKSNGVNVESNHTVQVGLTYNLDLRHKQTEVKN